MENLVKVACVLIPALATILVAVIERNASKERSAARLRDEKLEARAKIREEESRLSMKMMDATLQLSIVTANALTGGHNNGNVEQARQSAKAAREEYNAFVQKVAAHEIAK